MNKITNIFIKHKIILALFFLLFLVFIFFHFKYALGMFFDMPAMFFTEIIDDYEPTKFIFFHDIKIRSFTNILVAIPFNVFRFCFKDTHIINLISAFGTSYIFMHFCVLILNYFIAIRTKRFDIAVICFAFYTFFCLQNVIWACREVNLAVLFYFSILSYFFSKQKITKIDYIPILLIMVYLFESFETSCFLGLLLFIFALIYHKNRPDDINKNVKLLIGLLGLAVFFYIPLRLYCSGKNGLSIENGIDSWLDSFPFTVQNLFKSNSLIILYALLALVFIMFYKKTFKIKSIPFLLIYSALIIYTLYLKTGFIPQPVLELSHYSFTFFFIFPTVFIIFLFDYKGINFRENFLSNLIVISCITGIIGLAWQINSCFMFDKYVKYLKNLIASSQETFIKIPKEDIENKPFLKFDTEFGSLHKTIFLSENKNIDKLIIPTDTDASDYPNATTFYDKENDVIILQTSFLKPVSPYWNLTKIKEKFKT